MNKATAIKASCKWPVYIINKLGLYTLYTKLNLNSNPKPLKFCILFPGVP